MRRPESPSAGIERALLREVVSDHGQRDRWLGAHLRRPHRARDAAELLDMKRRVLESGTRQRAQLRIVVGGNEQPYDVFLEPPRDASGKIHGVRGVVTRLDA
jgi:hypothetical protein